MKRAGAPIGPIGVLGGSFDPVHAGHTRLARDAQAGLALAQLRLLPAGLPWQKGAITPAYHRVAMLDLALQDEGGRGDASTPADWELDTREARSDAPAYTVDTLRALRAEFGPQVPLVWIMGQDQLERLDTWRQWRSLSELAHVAYARRPGSGAAMAPELADFVARRRGTPAGLAAQPAGSFVEFAMEPVDCSATQIRAALARGDYGGARRYLAPSVLAYIQTHQLYLAVHG